jgi:pyridoxamine 5'-phosphate oxidase-like protein
MMLEPVTEAMARPGKGTSSPNASTVPFDWASIHADLRSGAHRFWLTTVSADGDPHVVPVFVAWVDSVCYVASKSTARKTRDMEATGRCAIACDTGPAHVIVEATARRMTGDPGMHDASAAFAAVYGWPTTVVGDEIDAPFAAPTSGGPPLQVWELTPTKAFAFPADGESDAPTRWRF